MRIVKVVWNISCVPKRGAFLGRLDAPKSLFKVEVAPKSHGLKVGGFFFSRLGGLLQKIP